MDRLDLPALLESHLMATLDMLENAIVACPDDDWALEDGQSPQFWYLAYHTIFFLDLYFSESLASFSPPPPFTLSEIDPSGVLPERVYSKAELTHYLQHGRNKTRAVLREMTEQRALEHHDFRWIEGTTMDFVLLTIRHVQHHTAQLNLLLRQRTASAPPWVTARRK